MSKLIFLLIATTSVFWTCRMVMAQTQTNSTTVNGTILNINLTGLGVPLAAAGGAKLIGAVGLLKVLKLFKSLAMRRESNGFIGRCLGAARRIKMLMPFFIFKMGVIVTVLGFLTIFSMKSLVIGVILLILNAGGIFSKLSFLKGYGIGYQKEHSSWQPPRPSLPPAPSVHLHVHKDQDGGYSYQGHGKYEAPGPTGYSYQGHGKYEAPGPTAWADRIGKGLSETKTAAERTELINLYTRLGLDVNAALNKYANHKQAYNVRTK